MKSKTILSLIAISILLSSCLVNSLHPFYEEEDIFYDGSILGKWEANDSTIWTVRQIYLAVGEGEEKKEYYKNGYVIGYKDEDGKPTAFDVFIFKINNQTYADFYPSLYPTALFENAPDLYSIRTHVLAKVEITNDQIELTWFNGEWLAGLIENNRIKISHEFIRYPEPISQKFKGQYVLTATTSELKKFIKLYGDDENAFLKKEGKILPDGTYHWNAGDGTFTGKMTFGEGADYTHIILRKLNEQE
ncbi:MAG: hypothetical protein ACFE9R_12830 [Candidatus Hermodarchaeota archaeon]